MAPYDPYTLCRLPGSTPQARATSRHLNSPGFTAAEITEQFKANEGKRLDVAWYAELPGNYKNIEFTREAFLLFVCCGYTGKS